MSVPFKPADYSVVSPYLVVDGAERTIDFLVRVFGASIGPRRHDVVDLDPRGVAPCPRF